MTPRGQRNEATVIAPDGRFLGVYGKQHPAIVFADDQTSLTRGPVPIYRTALGHLGTIICFDLDYTDTARTAARHGARLLAVPSWDPPGDATKHYDLLVFRAIEDRLTMVKADAAYDSAVIDPYGRILAKSVTGKVTRPRLSPPTCLWEAAVACSSWRSGYLWGWLFVGAAVLVTSGVQRATRHLLRSGSPPRTPLTRAPRAHRFSPTRPRRTCRSARVGAISGGRSGAVFCAR